MATEAQLRAIKKWSTEKVDEIKIRVEMYSLPLTVPCRQKRKKPL